jgi:hypothetical protein
MFPFLHYTFGLCRKKSTRVPHGAFRELVSHSLRVTFGLVFLFWSSNCDAQVFESFDSSRAKFRLWNSDANAIVTPTKKTEPGVEVIEVTFGNGSFVHLIYPIEPSALIEDLRASMRIRSAQGGLKIGFRVVFPRSTNPATHNPFAEVLYGSATNGGGTWGTSSIENVAKQFEACQRFLRAKYGPSVNLQDPYVDAIVLSVYSWPTGTIKMQVDDLQVEGMVAPSISDPDSDIAIDESADVSQLSVNDQLLQLQATVPRWIQYQGESLDYLKSLGFNAIITSRGADPLVVEQAVRSRMGVIATPPDSIPAENVAKDYQHIQGWLLGWKLDQSNLDQTRTRVGKVSRFPQSLARPMIGEAMEMYGSYSRMSDWLAVPMPLPTRVRSSKEAAEIMRSELRPLAGRSVPLTSIVTQIPSEWIAQKDMAVRALGVEPSDTANYDLLQVRMQVFRTMMQGARGWMFRSGTPLDTGDLTSMARSEGYAGVNREIDLLMPWIRAGQSSWTPLTLDSANYTGAILETPNSQLGIIVASGPMDQICTVAPKTERLQVTLPISGQARNVFRITHGELQLIRPQPTPGGLVVTIENPCLVEQIVSVVDPKPISYLREQLANVGPALVESRIEIARQVLEIAQKTLVEQQVPAQDPRWDSTREAESHYRNATRYLAASNIPAGLKEADLSILLAQRVVRNAWEEAANQFGAFQSSPLIASPLSLPLHFQFNRLLAGRPWQSLPFLGVPFRDIDSFYQSAWQVDRRLTDTVQSDCTIGDRGPSGQPCLVLSAKSINPEQPIPSGYAGASMLVSSPALKAPLGAMIQFKGVVRIESRPNETQSGLLICDSLGGDTLGQLISSSDPSEFQWRRFSLVRFVTQPEGIRLHFEARGEIRAAISDLQAEMIVPTQPVGLPTRLLDPEETFDATMSVPVGFK